MSNKLAFLSGEPDQVEETIPAETVAAEAPAETSQESPARDPQGRFAAREEAAAETPAEPSETAVAAEETPAPVVATETASEPPLSAKETTAFFKAMMEEREKRQAAEKRLAELQAKQPQTAQEPLAPAQQQEQQRYADNLRFSRKFAEREYGKDTMAKVHDWATARCDADPIFNQQMMGSEDPYEAAYQAFNREQKMAAIEPLLSDLKPEDLAAFKSWQAEQAKAASTPAPAPAAPAAPPTPAPAPPRSLATASGTGAVGKDLPVHPEPGGAFRATIT